MSNDNEYKMRIHHGCVTDHEAGEKIRSHTPTSWRKAQDLLVATKKYVKKSGFLSSEQSRLLKIQSECYELRYALEREGFMVKELSQKGPVYVMIEFLSLFSDAYPNWQKEYDTLNDLMPMMLF